MANLIPVFPLSTVLFPGGLLPLRIFEPRYLSMVGQCMKQQSEFAVALITDGKEAGQPAEFYKTATLASILDFDQLDDGMLGITCRGTTIVDIGEQQVQDDNLILGNMEPRLQHPLENKSDNFFSIQAFLRQVLDREDLTEYRTQLREDWNDPDWISFRLSELLPIESESKQVLLEKDTETRIDLLAEMLTKSKLI